MSLRDEILEILADPALSRRTHEYTLGLIMCRIENEQARARSTVVLDETLGRSSGIEQGITRLALFAFVSGGEGPWNGVRRVNGKPETAWARYRGHQIDREHSPDGLVVRITYRDHANAEQVATFENVHRTPTEAALLMVEDIDDLLDIVIEENGLPGDEIPDAEVVERIDGATTERVLRAYAKWIGVEYMGTVIRVFAEQVDKGEVEP